MRKLLGFIHRWEWLSPYFNPPYGHEKVPVEVFLPIAEEGCRMPPPEIEREWYLRGMGYTYTVTAVTVRKEARKLARSRVINKEAASVMSEQLMFDFANRS